MSGKRTVVLIFLMIFNLERLCCATTVKTFESVGINNASSLVKLHAGEFG